MISVASTLAHTDEGKNCQWKDKLDKKWKWFQRTYDEWSALEKDIKRTIDEVDKGQNKDEQKVGEDEENEHRGKRREDASKTFLYISSLSLQLHRLQASGLSSSALEAAALLRLSRLHESAMRQAK
uniref:Uncharacterized protein n=1 Tax=Palpitomonas bilix TaxID=652834 RepID=A0A7S3D9A3_9EUKA